MRSGKTRVAETVGPETYPHRDLMPIAAIRPRRPIRRLTVTPSANCSGSLVRYLFRDGSLSDLSHGIWATLQSGPGELWVATTQAHELNLSFREVAKEVRSQRHARINHAA